MILKLFANPRHGDSKVNSSEESEKMNKPKENINNEQVQKVEEFMNFYVNNTQWK
jgi:hypothetical protein